MKRALILLAIIQSCYAAQIYFTGVCGDCQGNALAALTVTGFDPANPFTLTLSKFVSFSYAGTDLVPPFVIDSTNVTNVSGSLGPTYPRAYDVRIDAAPGTPSFVSFADGQWALSSGQGLDDLGTISSYSLTPVSTPEPGAAFVGAGVLLLAIASIRRRGRLRAACLPAAVIAVCSTHASAATISSFTTAEDGLVLVPGQSVTTPAGGPWNNLTFSWLFFGSPTASGLLFLLTEPYTGNLLGLNSATPGFLASTSTIVAGAYVFSPSVTVQLGKQYFFYSPIDIALTGSFTRGYPGGNLFDASEGTFVSKPDFDADFLFSGLVITTSAPEPEPLVLILAGLIAIVSSRFARRIQ
jgi:hypothetical protein